MEIHRINNEVVTINILSTQRTVETGIMLARIQPSSEGGVVNPRAVEFSLWERMFVLKHILW